MKTSLSCLLVLSLNGIYGYRHMDKVIGREDKLLVWKSWGFVDTRCLGSWGNLWPSHWRQSEKQVTLQCVRHKSATVAKIASDLEAIPECKSNWGRTLIKKAVFVLWSSLVNSLASYHLCCNQCMPILGISKE